MPRENEDQRMDVQDTEDDNTTVVHEFRSDATGEGSGAGDTGGGAGGGGPSGGEEPYVIGVFVDGSGQVTGSAVFNPESGAVEDPEIHVQVVEETRLATDQGTASAGGSPDASSVGDHPSAPGGDEGDPNSGWIPPMAVIPPTTFVFTQRNNLWVTTCIELRLAYRVGGRIVGTPVSVFLRIEARRRLTNGTDVTAQDAANWSSVAATEAGNTVVEGLETYTISPAQVPEKFVTLMQHVLNRHGRDSHVRRCQPGT